MKPKRQVGCVRTKTNKAARRGRAGTSAARAAAKVRPDLLRLFEQALRFQSAHQNDAALGIYDKILDIEPNNTDALFMRAQVLMHQNRFREALVWARRAVASKPKNPNFRFITGYNYYGIKRPFDAMRHLKKTLKLQPDYSMARLLLARCYADVGNSSEARACLDSGPVVTGNPIERLTLATVLAHVDRVTEARDLIREGINNAEALPGCYYELVSLPGKHWTDTDREQINSLLGERSWPPEDASALHFASARIDEAEQRYDDAFENYKLGNDQPAAAGFDVETYRQTLDRIRNLFVPELFDEKSGLGNPSRVPVFLIGMPRAGKSVIEGALSRHPLVHGAGEITLHSTIEGGLILGLKTELPADYEAKVSGLTRAEANQLSQAYLEEIRRYSPRSRFVLNSLPQNFQNVGILAILFPNAKFIHVRRDPIDTCFFCFRKKFQYEHNYSNDLRTMGLYYRAYADIMDHWHAVLPERIFDVSYEEFVDNPGMTFRKLLEFFDLDSGDDDLRAGFRAGIRTIEAGHEPMPVNNSYVGYWKNFRRHLGPLIEALGDRANP